MVFCIFAALIAAIFFALKKQTISSIECENVGGILKTQGKWISNSDETNKAVNELMEKPEFKRIMKDKEDSFLNKTPH